MFSACNGANIADQFVGNGVGSGSTTINQGSLDRAILVTGISSASFPNTNVNSNSTINVTVSNSGTAPAVLSSANLVGIEASITSDTCSFNTLAVGSFCNIILKFSPTGIETVLETLTVPYTGGGSFTLTNTFSATSVMPDPVMVSSPGSYDFGSVQIGSNGTHSFVVSNTSTGPASLQASTITGSGFSITADTCTGVTNMINGGSTCTVTVKFLPLVAGTVLSTLTLNFQNAGGTAFTKNISLTAIGSTPQPTLTLSPNPFNFGSVPTSTSATQTISVSNASAANATLGTLTVAGTGFTIASQTCNSTVLVPGAACQAIIKFSPLATGAVTGTFTVPYSAADGTAYTGTVNLGGTGTVPATSFTFAGATGSANLAATGVTLQWSAQTLASYYVIRWTTGGTTLTSNHVAPTSLNSYNITGLSPNTTYTLRVNAYDLNDNSDGNVATVTITTPNVTGATFNGWSDVVALGNVYTDIGTVDNILGNTGSNRLEQNLSAVAGFTSTGVNTGTGQLTSNTTFATGTSVVFNSDTTAPGGLTNGSTYYVINVNSTTMKLATSAANAAAGTAITLTTAGSGNMTLMPNSVVKLGWDLFTFTPTATATSYHIYRDTSAGFATASLVGTSTSNSFSDWSTSGQTTYYYKVVPMVSGVEITPTTVGDSIIQVYVPPQNMALLHRWIVNREACVTLLGTTYSTGVNRNDNYSCSYAWGGAGATAYAPNSTRDKTKWDLGYSMVVDRWQNGCKMKTYGSAAPTGGSVNDVYLKTGTSTLTSGSLAVCYIKDSVSGWVPETGSLTNTSRSLIRTNYPGYTSTGLYQAQAYSTCQQKSVSGVVDGNGNTKLRLMRLNEAVLARAVQGINVNNRSSAILANIFNGLDLPNNGSCNTQPNNQSSNSINSLNGVTIPNPSTYSLSAAAIMNGSYLNRNCYSRYEISTLWDQTFEYVSSQFFVPNSSGTGYFLASGLDPADNMLEGYLLNGTVGPNPGYATNSQNVFNTNSNAALLPLFGVRAVSADAVLGSKNPVMSSLDYGQSTNSTASEVSYDGSALNAIIMGTAGNYTNTSRYQFSGAPATATYNYWGGILSNYSLRCSGQVGP